MLRIQRLLSAVVLSAAALAVAQVPPGAGPGCRGPKVPLPRVWETWKEIGEVFREKDGQPVPPAPWDAPEAWDVACFVDAQSRPGKQASHPEETVCSTGGS